MAADDLPAGALDLAGAVGVHGQQQPSLVEHDVVVPPAIIFEIREAGAAAVGPVRSRGAASHPDAGWSQPPTNRL